MSYYLIMILMCLSQFALVFLKHWNIRVIVNENVQKAMWLTLLIQIAWLVSSALGIKALLDKDILMVLAYLLSGVVGNYFNFKVKA